MSLTCSAALEGLASGLKEPECEPSLSAKSNLSAKQSLESIGQECQSLRTLENSPLPTSRNQLTLFAADTHASPSVLPGSDWARQMTVTSGLSISGLSKNSGPLGSLERTLLATSTWASTLCYLTWKAKGTPQGRLLFQLAPWTQSTDEIERGLWPTPRSCSAMAANITKEAIANAPERFPNLETAVALRMWPTPSSTDNRDRGNAASGAVIRRAEKGKQLMLSQVVSDVSGALNPPWVEWLMGFPTGWTDLKPSEMPLSRKSRKSSGGQS